MSRKLYKVAAELARIGATTLPIYVVKAAEKPSYDTRFTYPVVTVEEFLFFSFNSEDCARQAKQLRADVFKQLANMSYGSDSQIAAWLAYRETIRVERYLIRPADGDE